MSEQNINVVRRVYDAMASRDANVMQELFADDIRIWQSPLLPWGGEYERHEGAFTFLLKVVEHIQSQVTIENLFAAGDHVVQTGRTRGTVLANGASFDIPEVHVWEVRDGRVVELRAYIDTPAMVEALRRIG